jgi:quinol monooxygenase YgiN
MKTTKLINNLMITMAVTASLFAAATVRADAINIGGDTNSVRALFAYLKVQPGTEQQFLDDSADLIVESRKEPGCLIYIMHESEQDPTQFLIYELYQSDADLQAHRKAKYVVDYLSTVNPILVPGGFILNEFDVK